MGDFEKALLVLTIADLVLLLINFILYFVFPACPAGAFTVCALSVWHVIQLVIVVVSWVHIAAVFNERRARDDVGSAFPATVGAFVALATLVANSAIGAARYSLVAPLSGASWQWVFAWLLDALFVATAIGYTVIFLAMIVNYAQGPLSKGYKSLRQ